MSEELSEYEKQRLANIQRNEAELRRLGLDVGGKDHTHNIFDSFVGFWYSATSSISAFQNADELSRNEVSPPKPSER